MEPRTVQTRSGEITFREDGILCFRALPGVEQDKKNAITNVEAMRQVVGGAVVPVLVDIRKVAVVTREARQIYAHQVDFASSQALLVGSAFTRIVANLFLRVGRPEQPARLFASEADAVKWLEGFLR